MSDETRIIQIDAPAVVPREYARRVGLSEAAVRQKIARGELPTIRMGSKKGCTIMVNLMKLAEDALNVEH